MKTLHDLLLTNHPAENDDGLMALYHAVAWHPEIDSILFDANSRTPAPPNINVARLTQQLAPQPVPQPSATSNIQFAALVRDTQQHITDQLKVNLRRKHLPVELMEEAWTDAVIAAQLAQAAMQRPLKRRRY